MNSIKTIIPILLIIALVGVGIAFGVHKYREYMEYDVETELNKIDKENQERENRNTDFDNPLYDKEIEGAEITETTKPESAFIGKWKAGSDRAEYLYGNINLNIMPDGKWTGNITEEKYSGTWKYNGKGITLNSELVNCDLFYDSSGVMMFRDHDYPEDMLVLTSE